MRAVIDTNVFISGLMLPQSIPGRIIHAWRTGHFAVVLSEPMLSEISSVLSYPKIRKRIAWDDDTISRYLTCCVLKQRLPTLVTPRLTCRVMQKTTWC